MKTSDHVNRKVDNKTLGYTTHNLFLSKFCFVLMLLLGKYIFCSYMLSIRHRLKPGPGTWEKRDPLKNLSVQKTRPQGLKTLLFVSCHMKDNVKVIFI